MVDAEQYVCVITPGGHRELGGEFVVAMKVSCWKCRMIREMSVIRFFPLLRLSIASPSPEWH